MNICKARTGFRLQSKSGVQPRFVVVLVCAMCVAYSQAQVSTSWTGDGSVANLTVQERPTSDHTAATNVVWENGTLVDAHSYDFSLDSMGDILLIDATIDVVAGSVFNDLDPAHASNDVAPPFTCGTGTWRHFCHPSFDPATFDLWVTTPGQTGAADRSRLDQGMTVTHFDTTREPGVTDFHFAHITLVPDESGYAEARFYGEIQTSTDAREVEFNQFSVTMSFGTVPEPDGMVTILLALFGSLGIFRRRRNSRLFSGLIYR